MQYQCNRCDSTYNISPLRYQCDCGAPLTLQNNASRRYEWDINTPSLWRYRGALPISTDTHIVTLGEGITPLIPLDSKQNPNHYVKLDYLCPTGSYKDRGASVLLTHLTALGVTEVVEDSSGNAGAAIAAYSARAGIRCTIYCPESTSKGKLQQISAYGAALKLVPGNRMATTEAVKKVGRRYLLCFSQLAPIFLRRNKNTCLRNH